jgi:hypothetical protein
VSDYIITPYTVIIDSREQAPHSFQGFLADAHQKNKPLLVSVEVAGLKSGDYSLKGFEDRIAVERKSLQDAYSTFCQGRDRFERELARLNEMEYAAVVVEASWSRILARKCPDCFGAGFTIQPGEVIAFEVTLAMLKGCATTTVAELVKGVAVGESPEKTVKCERCGGAGKIHPLDHTKFSPKSFFRSVIAWQQRYPRIHWWMCETKAFAETVTLRILQRFWEDEQQRVKEAAKAV